MIDYEQRLIDELETPECEADENTVVDMSYAEYATRRIAEIEAAKAKVNALVDERIKALNQWRDEQLKPLDSDVNYYKGRIYTFAQQYIAEQGKKKKSRTLPNGALLSINKGKDDFARVSDDSFLQYLKDSKSTEYIKTETIEKPLWGEFKKKLKYENDKVISPDGEIIDCIVFVPGEEKYKVDISGVKVAVE